MVFSLRKERMLAMNVVQILSGPVIGAVIGYCTNYIAVKMLFRPLIPLRSEKLLCLLHQGLYQEGKMSWHKHLGQP
jgi:hypothetical protein